MRILYLGNNWLGWKVLQWLKEQGEEITGLVLPPPREQKFAEEILAAAGLPEERIFPGSRLRTGEVRDAVRSLRPDLGISILFTQILKPEFLALFPRGVINLHPALLPYNRGQYPNVWSIVEGTPSGTTLHYVDASVDTGDIIAQKGVAVEPVDTGESLYRKLEEASLSLFQEAWPLFKAEKAKGTPQDARSGTFHYTRDSEKIDRIDLDRTYRARDLIDILRARTFPPYRGAYFETGGKRVYLRLQLQYGKEETGRWGAGGDSPSPGKEFYPSPAVDPCPCQKGRSAITLRDIRSEDKELIRRWRNHPHVSLYMYRDHFIFPAEHERWLSDIAADPTRRYWIIREGEEDLGLVNLYNISLPDRRCHWAFYVADPGGRGRGVGTRTEYLILRHVFEDMKFNRLCCEVLASNRAVIEMHRRFGFVQEGYFRQHVIKGECPTDVVSLAMLREDWERKKPEILSHLQKKGLLEPERGAV